MEWVCGGGIESTSYASGCNNIIYFNSAYNDPECCGNISLTYSCISTGITGIGNITDNPEFVDTTNFDFHLLENSPCIDAGDPNSPPDPDSTIADMGAFYYDQSSWVFPKDGISHPTEFRLLPNYPNPFNPETRLMFSVPSTSRVRLTIFDITGRQVASVVDGWVSAGIHQYIWEAGGFPSGIYFAYLTANSEYQLQKLILIK